jgi:RNA polymerase sigma-70 factor (ECF subfamily)
MALSSFASSSEERDLVEKAKRDRDAFAVLYRRHYAMIAGYIYRRTGDCHLTDDLVAEVFLSALRSLGGYRHRGLPVRAWLYRIAANTVNRWVRRERTRITERLSEISKCEAQAMQVPPDTANAPDGECARLALMSLKPKYQTVLSLHYLEGMSLEEVAAAVGCRIGTVKSRLSRGRDALRERLTRRR